MIYKSCLASFQTTLDLGFQEIRKYQENLKISYNFNVVPGLLPKKENFVNASRNFLKNRKLTFSIVHYLTEKRKSASNIFSHDF